MTNATNTTIGNNLYPVANGTTSSNPFVWQFLPRDPTLNDVNFPIQKFWLNTANNGIWFLKNFVTTNGNVTANWIFLATGGQQFQSISDTADTPVFPSLSSDPVPNNIQLVGGTGITIISDPPNHLLTISAAGSVVVEEFALQSGTTPVVPLAGIVTFNGAAVVAGTHPVRTDGTGPNTMQLEVQTSQAIVSTNANSIGLSAFNSAQFSVDANGFVSATGSIPIQFTGNTGTATPSAGNINIFAASTAAGTSPASTAASGSTVTVNVQKAQAIASTNATNVGLSAFDSARFTVDANGFVSTSGTGLAETITGQSGGALAPTGGNWNIFGGTVVAGTAPLVTSGSGSTLTINAQRTQAIASTDSTKIGLAAFDSADFTVDANGFVSASTTGFIKTITGSSGGPIPPTANNVNLLASTVAAGTTPIDVVGSGSTLTIDVQKSQAIASADTTKIGLSNFDSAKFTVDANGFVSTSGTGIGQTITGQSGGALSPTAGNWNIFGGTVVAGTSPLVSSGSGSTLTLNAQRSQAIASTDSTKIGMAAFNSADFTVDSNGFVSAQPLSLNYTNVNHAASPYTVLTTDYYISVDCSGGSVTLNFPNSPTAKQVWIVKDRTGNAATSNISITTPGGTVTFDGATTYKIISNYGAINLLANATPTYEVY